ncbi:MAG: bifunctional chorismate mutase/prephenate dehydratase [Myxococcales bacterium]|nr:bifunctional chorismate mutase/prephenate dehydratase [Myxococcales bacterium]
MSTTDAPDADLDALRALLDEVDARLVAALAERRVIVSRVAEHKGAQRGGRVRDRDRERALLATRIEQGRRAGLDPAFVTRIFRQIVEQSVEEQRQALAAAPHVSTRPGDRPVVIVYQGGPGAFSHLAAARHFAALGDQARYEGLGSFQDLLEAVRERRADYAVLPIENSIAGSIYESYDLLASMGLSLVGETVQRIVHCLIALEDQPLESLRRIYSHPVALAQCRTFLGSLHGCHAEAYRDTALSVVKIKADGDPTHAAIASEEAAKLHGLPVLARDIADQRENFTRMVIVAREPEDFPLDVPCKTSLIFSTAHELGALARCIQLLSDHGLNLTKIESRPKPHVPWEYVFYVDFEGNQRADAVRAALEQLREQTTFLQVLGTYPSGTTARA